MIWFSLWFKELLLWLIDMLRSGLFWQCWLFVSEWLSGKSLQHFYDATWYAVRSGYLCLIALYKLKCQSADHWNWWSLCCTQWWFLVEAMVVIVTWKESFWWSVKDQSCWSGWIQKIVLEFKHNPLQRIIPFVMCNNSSKAENTVLSLH